MPVLDHERLTVYRIARELNREIARITKKAGSRRPDLNDQLLRATASIPLNIAEGNGEQVSRRRGYFFRIARSSAAEVGAVLDHMADLALLSNDDVSTAKQLLGRIVSMLVKLTEDAVARSSQAPHRPVRKASPNS